MSFPHWNVVEVAPQQWWAIDAKSGTAFSLPPETGERLWESHGLLERPLAEAMKDDASEAKAAFLDLHFMGVTARYISQDAKLIERLTYLYAAARPTLRCSPDLVVRIEPTADFDRLHRSVTTSRLGVTLREVGSSDWLPGALELPIIPPLQCTPMTGRYCALHGALLHGQQGGILVCGGQRAGKTSAALLAERLGIASILADEMVLIDGWGRASGIPLPLRERTAAGRDASPLPRTGGGETEPMKVRTIILLAGHAETSEWKLILAPEKRMQLISEHVRPLDGSLGRATLSLLRILRGANVWSWTLRPWPLLSDDLEHGFRTALEMRHA